jgi:hypothetical protein
LALRILNGEFADGDRIIAEVDRGELTFSKVSATSGDGKTARARSRA